MNKTTTINGHYFDLTDALRALDHMIISGVAAEVGCSYDVARAALNKTGRR